MKKLVVAVLLAASACAVFAQSSISCSPISVPDFFAKDFRTGKTIKLSDFRGKPIIVNFWFASCRTCRDEAPSFRKLAEENPDITVLSVTNPKHSKSAEAIEQFLDEYKWIFPTLLDPHDTIRDTLLEKTYTDWYSYPTTYFFDRKGRLVGRITRHIDWDKKESRRILKNLRENKLRCYFPKSLSKPQIDFLRNDEKKKPTN